MPGKKKAAEKKIRITLVKSSIGYSERHKRTVRALGFRRLHQTVVHDDTPVIRGMVALIAHLVKVEEQDAA